MPDHNVIDMRKGIYRRIYTGFIGGKRINSVSMEAECLFWRLHALADDLGNFPADTEMLVAQAFPRRKVKPSDIQEWLGELRAAKLIVLYRADDESFGHVTGWEEWQPAGRNGRRFQRFPVPVGNPGESGGIQCGSENPVASTTLHSEDHSKVHSEDHTKRRAADAAGVPIPSELDTPAFGKAWAEWLDYRRSKGKPVSAKAAARAFGPLIRAGPAAAIVCIERSIANDWQGLFPENQRTGASNDADRRRSEKAAREFPEPTDLLRGLRIERPGAAPAPAVR